MLNLLLQTLIFPLVKSKAQFVVRFIRMPRSTTLKSGNVHPQFHNEWRILAKGCLRHKPRSCTQPAMNSWVKNWMCEWGKHLSEFGLLYHIPDFPRATHKLDFWLKPLDAARSPPPKSCPKMWTFHPGYKTCINTIPHVSHSLAATPIYWSLQRHVLLNLRKSFENTHCIFCQFPLVHTLYFPLDEAKRKAKF